MQLFQLKNYNVIIEPVALTITVFANIKKSNKNDEDLTIKELSFIWFYCDVRSDFISIIDDDERFVEVRQSLALPDNWKMSKEVLAAIRYYKEHSITPSSGLYEASITAAKFIQDKLKQTGILLEEKDLRGVPVYKLGDILNMIKLVPDIMEKLHKARLQVIQELEAQGGLKGNKEKKLFEDGINTRG